MLRWLLAICVLLSWSVPALAKEIKRVRLEIGYVDENTLHGPVLDGSSLAPLHVEDIAAGYNRDANVIRTVSRGMFTGGVNLQLSRSVDLAALLSRAMRSEFATMGIAVAPSPGTGWTLTGTLRDIFLDTRRVPYGPMLFYGHLDLEVVLAREGSSRRLRMGVHHLYHRYNGGFGLRDEAEEALTHFLVDAAQEIGSRINREVLGAPAAFDVGAKIDRIRAQGVDDNELLVREVALAASEDDVPALLRLLESTREEDDRVPLISALGLIASPKAVRPLIDRYRGEDEDCRLYIVSALDAIGTEEAMAFIEDGGARDKDRAVQSFVAWIEKRGPLSAAPAR